MYDYSEALFPCEFCGETFPEDIFIQHQVKLLQYQVKLLQYQVKLLQYQVK